MEGHTERFIVATVDDHDQKHIMLNTEAAALSQAKEWAEDDLNQPVYICKILGAYNLNAPTPNLSWFND